MDVNETLRDIVTLKKNLYELGSITSKLKTVSGQLNAACRDLVQAHLKDAEDHLGLAWTAYENAQTVIQARGPDSSKNNDRTWS